MLLTKRGRMVSGAVAGVEDASRRQLEASQPAVEMARAPGEEALGHGEAHVPERGVAGAVDALAGIRLEVEEQRRKAAGNARI